MQWDKLITISTRFLVLSLSAVLLFRGLALVFPWLLPFLLAMLLALLFDPPVQLLVRLLHAPRWLASALTTLLFSALLLGCGLLAGQRIWLELSSLCGRLPELAAQLPVTGGALEQWFYRITVAAPAQYQAALDRIPELLGDLAASLSAGLSQLCLSWTAQVAAALPSVLLAAFTTLLAAYFFSLSLPSLGAALEELIPARWAALLRTGRIQAAAVILGWIRAQLTLLGVTFASLIVGLLFLRVSAPLLLACLITLVDALPILGSGTILIPWAVFSLLSGDAGRCLGLLILYAAISLLRSLLEPKLLGAHSGLPPLAALAAMYLGYSAWGIAGLLLAPPAAMLLFRLWRCGLFASFVRSKKEAGDIN